MECKLKDVGSSTVFVFEAMEPLRSDIARHEKNGIVRSHDQEVFKGKTTKESGQYAFLDIRDVDFTVEVSGCSRGIGLLQWRCRRGG
jgi:hypothetical protein